MSVCDIRASATVGLLSAHDTRRFFLFALDWALEALWTESVLGGPVRH